MSVGLGRSKLDSKGGVVGGNIDVNTLEMVCEYLRIMTSSGRVDWFEFVLFNFASGALNI
jgi:hypothetical protein